MWTQFFSPIEQTKLCLFLAIFDQEKTIFNWAIVNFQKVAQTSEVTTKDNEYHPENNMKCCFQDDMWESSSKRVAFISG